MGVTELQLPASYRTCLRGPNDVCLPGYDMRSPGSTLQINSGQGSHLRIGSLSSTTSTHPILYHIRPTFYFTIHSRPTRCPHICISVPQGAISQMLTNDFHSTDWDAEPISPVNFMEKEIGMTCLHVFVSRSPSEPDTCVQRFMNHFFRLEIHFVSIIA